MIAYFDTSAFVPLVVREQATERAGRLWDAADRLVTVHLLYAEAWAALAQARRMGRLEPKAYRAALGQLDLRYAEMDRILVDESLVRRAGALADELALRGHDAVHLAAAERVADDETVLVAGDRKLCAAAAACGLQVGDIGR